MTESRLSVRRGTETVHSMSRKLPDNQFSASPRIGRRAGKAQVFKGLPVVERQLALVSVPMALLCLR